MKKIVQINSVVNIGSTGRIAEEIGSLAIENGWDSYIAYGRDQKSSKSKLIKIGNNIDLKWHGLNTRIFDTHGFSSKKSTLEFIKKLELLKPDIVHLHNIHGYYINIEILFNYLGAIDKPIVWTLHDCWPYTGHCIYYSSVNCNKWKVQCGKCPQIKTYPASLIFDNSKINFIKKKNIFNSISDLTIIPVSEWLSREVQFSFLSKHPRKVINNGIDLNIFKPRSKLDLINRLELNGKFIILGVANIWEKRKGLNDFVLLSNLLKNDEVIVLIGLNKEQLINLPNNIIGLERTESLEDLGKYYSMADVFFNPSLEETFGLTTLEALACGTPAIVYNATASPELISKNTGFIIEQHNIEDVYNKIQLIKGVGKKQFEKSCRISAEKGFSKEERLLEYINLYEKLTEN